MNEELRLDSELEIIDEYSGRNANKNLNFREWSRSKHAQYFTPSKLGGCFSRGAIQIIANDLGKRGERLSANSLKRIMVFDPAAGSGRLLRQVKKDGFSVLGIEMDEEPYAVLKHIVGVKNSRRGDIRSYAEYIKFDLYDFIFTNPPYGLIWEDGEVEGFDNSKLNVSGYKGQRVESQGGVIEIATRGLVDTGYMFAIIPSTTWKNQKDKGLVQYIHDCYRVLWIHTVPDMFLQEYDIRVEVDIVVMQRQNYRNYMRFELPRTKSSYKELLESWDDLFRQHVVNSNARKSRSNWFTFTYYRKRSEEVYGLIPDMSMRIIYDCTGYDNVRLTRKGVTGSILSHALLYTINRSVFDFSKVEGKRAGIIEARADLPNIIRYGSEDVRQLLEAMGFKVECSQASKDYFQRQSEKFEVLMTPLSYPKAHQMLSWFEDKYYVAKGDYEIETADGGTFTALKEGKEYHIRPTWMRESSEINRVAKEDNKGNSYIEITSVDRGYLLFEVKGEEGKILQFRESESAEIEAFLKVFDLPIVDSIAMKYPDVVTNWSKQIVRTGIPLFDYQLEDLSVMMTKPCTYLGYEMGGGKTITSLVGILVSRVRRALIICQSGLVKKWIEEGRKFGIEIKPITTHKSIDVLLKKVRKDRGTPVIKTDIYITSYEFLSLDTGRVYDAWQCIKYDKDGNVIHDVISVKGKCSKGHKHEAVVRQCPKCKADTSEGWTGNYCNACGYSAYTYTPNSVKQYPAYKRISKLFSFVVIDEAQMAKSKSLRGLATRAFKTKRKMILSGTIQRGYITDVYWNFGWLLGHGTPTFPYKYEGGTKKFIEEYGTFEIVSKEFEDTLTTGRRKIIPEVSNLNRFWRILGSFTIRRLKDQMVKLPEKHRYIRLLPLDPAHEVMYGILADEAKKAIDRELRKDDSEINMGVISRWLWKLRFASTFPISESKLESSRLSQGHKWNKLMEVEKIISEVYRKGEKALVFSGLIEMQAFLQTHLKKLGYRVMRIAASHGTNRRFEMIEEFANPGNNYVALISGLNVLNRGFDIQCANHVIFTDVSYVPEDSDQAEDRAHRTGQEKEVYVYYLMGDSTIDIDMLDVITQKRKAISHAINAEAKFASTAELLQQMKVRNAQIAIAENFIEETMGKIHRLGETFNIINVTSDEVQHNGVQLPISIDIDTAIELTEVITVLRESSEQGENYPTVGQLNSGVQQMDIFSVLASI